MKMHTGLKYLDSRDVIRRRLELWTRLTGEHEESYRDEHDNPLVPHVNFWEWLDAEDEHDNDAAHELKVLLALDDAGDQLFGLAWKDGVTLIRDDAFEDYAREFAADMHGDAVRKDAWPFFYIDWEAAAAALQEDYRSIEFYMETYWGRA